MIARTAALLNGIAGRSIELCEGLRLVSGQAAMQVLPGVLAVGEQAGSTGRDMLTALLLGYDVAARLAGGFTPRPLAHQNGQVSLLAAAAAGARLRGLDTSGISRAMRIATTLLLTPELYQRGGRCDRAERRRRHERLCRRAGTRTGARRLRGAGRRGRTGAGPTGRRRLHRRLPVGRTRHDLAHHAQLLPPLRVLQPDPSGARLPATGAGRVAAAPDEIARIDFATYRFASVMRNPDPPNLFASKYSLPHAAATMVVRGHAGHAALDDTAVHDPAIAALASSGDGDRGSGNERGDTAASAGARDLDPDRWPQRHACLRQPPGRF